MEYKSRTGWWKTPAGKRTLKVCKENRRAKLRAIVDEAKRNKPCMDCKHVFDPICMDFDHVRGEKKFNIKQAAQRRLGLQVLLDEIAKCDLVCSNCHRLRTLHRGQADYDKNR